MDEIDQKIEQALQTLRAGKVILVTDDADRENEGDLIAASQSESTEILNFMAKEAKGLICMPLANSEAARLQLHPMVQHNTDNHETAFTVSIDAIETTTGISAEERAFTARQCCRPDLHPSDLRRPGHLFPLIAKEGGVLERNGHTEATVDLMRLAGLHPIGLCCEIMAEDGTMMRESGLCAFAEKHQIPKISIQEIQSYRKRHDILIEALPAVSMPTKFGTFHAIGFVDLLHHEHHVALVKGNLHEETPVLCRVHSECLTGDTFGSMRCDCGDQLHQAMRMIEREGRGVLLYMRQEGRGIGLINKLRAYALQEQGMDTLDANLALGFPGDAREYYIGAQILRHLGCRKLRLMTNNPDKVYQLEGFGMQIVDRIPIEIAAHSHDACYLHTKKERMGHWLEEKEA